MHWKHPPLFRETGQMSHFCDSKCILTGTSRVSYLLSKQIPGACLKAKSPQAPEWLASPAFIPLASDTLASFNASSIFTQQISRQIRVFFIYFFSQIPDIFVDAICSCLRGLVVDVEFHTGVKMNWFVQSSIVRTLCLKYFK